MEKDKRIIITTEINNAHLIYKEAFGGDLKELVPAFRSFGKRITFSGVDKMTRKRFGRVGTLGTVFVSAAALAETGRMDGFNILRTRVNSFFDLLLVYYSEFEKRQVSPYEQAGKIGRLISELQELKLGVLA